MNDATNREPRRARRAVGPSSFPSEPSKTPSAATQLLVLAAEQEGIGQKLETPTLVMPLEASVARLTIGKEELTLDRSVFAVVPSDTQFIVRASASVVRFAQVSFHESAFDRVALAYEHLGLDRQRLARWLQTVAVLPRTVWTHEIVHRFVFERHALGEPDNNTTRFLEIEILKEVYYLFRDRDDGNDRATIQQKHSETVERAVGYLEAHLFEVCSMTALAKAARTSESSLLRAFRRELGCTPIAYWRQRKLDGALDLLRSGRATVAEIATTVGYENATAFGHAFRSRFGHPPSSFRPRGTIRPAPES